MPTQAQRDGVRYSDTALGWVVGRTVTYHDADGAGRTVTDFWFGPHEGRGNRIGPLCRLVRVWDTELSAEAALCRIFGSASAWRRRGLKPIPLETARRLGEPGEDAQEWADRELRRAGLIR